MASTAATVEKAQQLPKQKKIYFRSSYSEHTNNQIIKNKKKLTTSPLILNRSNGTFLPPINSIRQPVTGPGDVTLASGLRLREPAVRVDPCAQEHGLVLVVSEISEPVQAQLVGLIFAHVVVLVDEVQVILKNLEPSVLLSNPVVGFAMPS